ncbi:glycosyltransferase family 4 protein [Oceanobacillus kapialis]|uniref:glycosyltransferase family 4 protein n=1 Tax=Oceanobacillus kapialis TaxID=481353 RepID=UPI00384D4173
MKILITTDVYSPVINGVVTSIVNLKRELEKFGHEVRVLTLSNEIKSYIEQDVTYISSLGVGKIYPGARVTISKKCKYLKELMEWRPDVIHSQCEFSTFRLAKHLAKSLHVPIIHTYHTVYEDYTHYFSPKQSWGKAMVAFFSKKVLKHATTVIAPTEKVSTLLQGYGVKRPIKVIPTGIDLSSYKQGNAMQARKDVRNQLNIPEKNRVLIFVGRLAKEKNLEEVLSNFSRVKLEDMSLLIVGDGPHRQALEEYARKLNIEDNVIFTGMVDPKELPPYYQAADIFVSASNSETQGLTYIEALASGLPALCRKDPCLTNVIVDGTNGGLFETFEEFERHLEKMLCDQEEYRYLSIHAKKKAYENYSSTAFAKSLESVYYDAIELFHPTENVFYVNNSGINQ